MIDIVVLLLLITAFYNKEKTAIFFAVMVALFTFLSDTFTATLAILDGWCYFFVGGLLDCVFIATVAVFARPSQTTFSLLCVALCSVLLNAYGAFLWNYELSLMPYDNSFLLLYVLAILTIFRGQGARINNNNLFRSANYKSFLLY